MKKTIIISIFMFFFFVATIYSSEIKRQDWVGINQTQEALNVMVSGSQDYEESMQELELAIKEALSADNLYGQKVRSIAVSLIVGIHCGKLSGKTVNESALELRERLDYIPQEIIDKYIFNLLSSFTNFDSSLLGGDIKSSLIGVISSSEYNEYSLAILSFFVTDGDKLASAMSNFSTLTSDQILSNISEYISTNKRSNIISAHFAIWVAKLAEEEGSDNLQQKILDKINSTDIVISDNPAFESPAVKNILASKDIYENVENVFNNNLSELLCDTSSTNTRSLSFISRAKDFVQNMDSFDYDKISRFFDKATTTVLSSNMTTYRKTEVLRDISVATMAIGMHYGKNPDNVASEIHDRWTQAGIPDNTIRNVSLLSHPFSPVSDFYEYILYGLGVYSDRMQISRSLMENLSDETNNIMTLYDARDGISAAQVVNQYKNYPTQDFLKMHCFCFVAEKVYDASPGANLRTGVLQVFTNNGVTGAQLLGDINNFPDIPTVGSDYNRWVRNILEFLGIPDAKILELKR